MYEITSWEDVRRVAPSGAMYFRYRRPTGERRKFYEGGYAFPLDTESLHARKPLKKRGVFAVYFYTAEEGEKEAHEARPLIIQPPDCDELLVEFPKRYKQGGDLAGMFFRDQLNCIKDLARTAAGTSDASLRLLEKVSHERDLMAIEAEKNRIGPIWQLILSHHPEIKELILSSIPLLATVVTKITSQLTQDREATRTIINEVKSRQQATVNEMSQSIQATMNEMSRVLGEMQKKLAEMEETKSNSASKEGSKIGSAARERKQRKSKSRA